MGTPLLLNLPLNRSGRLHDTIAELLRGFWRLRVIGPVCPPLLELSLFAEPTGF